MSVFFRIGLVSWSNHGRTRSTRNRTPLPPSLRQASPTYGHSEEIPVIQAYNIFGHNMGPSLEQFLIEKYKILVYFILFLSFKINLQGVNTTYQSNINSMLFNAKLSTV